MNLKKYPLVTVYVPTRNRFDLLKNAIDSVLAQTYDNIEIIVVDDASEDATAEYLTLLSSRNDKVAYYTHSQPRGANAARNTAIKKANGFFVTGLDDDDEMLPTRIEKLVNAYQGDCAFVFSRYTLLDKNMEEKSPRLTLGDLTFHDMLFGNLAGNQVLARKELFLKAGLFDEGLEAAQDLDMWLRLLKLKNRAIFVNEPLYKVNISSSNRITDSVKRRRGYFVVYNRYRSYMNDFQRRKNLLHLRKFQKRKIKTIKMFFVYYPFLEWPKFIAFKLRLFRLVSKI